MKKSMPNLALCLGLMIVLVSTGCPPTPTSSVKVEAIVHGGPPDFLVVSGPAPIWSGGALTVPTGGYAGLHFSGASLKNADLDYRFTDPEGNAYRRIVHVDSNGQVAISATKSEKGLEEVIVIVLIGIEGILSMTQQTPIFVNQGSGFDVNVPLGFAVTQVSAIIHTTAGDLSFVIQPSANADLDNDGLPDAWEREFFGQPSDCIPGVDSDGDGLSNREEYLYGTNPVIADTDHDGIGDGNELFYYFTDPLAWDTDGDGFSDGEEVVAGTDPLDINSHPGTNVTVPNVVGETEVLARQHLTVVGLVPSVSYLSSNTMPAGNVISSNPVAGVTVPAGSTIELIVSTGSASGQASVNIASPEPGTVFKVGDQATLTIKVKGVAGGAPYSLLVRYGEFGQDSQITIPLPNLGTTEVTVTPAPTFTFHFVTNGALFSARLTDHNGQAIEADCSYSVQ